MPGGCDGARGGSPGGGREVDNGRALEGEGAVRAARVVQQDLIQEGERQLKWSKFVYSFIQFN